MDEAFEVEVDSGRLAGRPGDWLLRYGEGGYGIVAAEIFAETYEVL